jgi:hypothetical protein
MDMQIKQTEELFLKIFKVAVLVFMSLALLSVIVLGLNVAVQSAKTPKEPSPARKAPEERQVTMEDLKKFLQTTADKTSEQKPSQAPPKLLAPTLNYLEDVTRLYRCSGEFAKKVGAEIIDDGNAAQRLEALRVHVEIKAADVHRGERWVKAVTEFACAALADLDIIALRKSGKIENAFYAVLNFHMAQWDAIQGEKTRFEQAELARVERERAQEISRIAEARASALTSAIAAGVAFGIFMLLAIYLLGAKIETNLREINESIRAFSSSSVQT